MKHFQYSLEYHLLQFKFTAQTSRGSFTEKPTWFLTIKDLKTGNIGKGECSPLPGLSLEYDADYEEYLNELIDLDNKSNLSPDDLLLRIPKKYSSIIFGFEMAIEGLKNQNPELYFHKEFFKGNKKIPINGLIWMGSEDFMVDQIHAKLEEGYKCLKMKIGAIDFHKELDILRLIRQTAGEELILRVDANGAFDEHGALEKLNLLSEFQIHSIEQPIKQGNWEAMKSLCENTPIPIALDEELIGIYKYNKKKELLEFIKPQYITLKPSLHGGFKSCNEWIELAEQNAIDWWITSALESNVGLSAIAQYAAYKDTKNRLHGLGTGQLYLNNIDCGLVIEDGYLFKK